MGILERLVKLEGKLKGESEVITFEDGTKKEIKGKELLQTMIDVTQKRETENTKLFENKPVEGSGMASLIHALIKSRRSQE
ncbi:MAG TPA: hypothetical protein VF941_06635 [Clostridia bacterium]